MLLVDYAEPESIYSLLSKSVPTEWANLNGENKNLADYFWVNSEGKAEQAERKHWSEIIPDIDKVENQLDQQRELADVHYLIIEDLLLPRDNGAVSYHSIEERSRQRGKGTYLSTRMGWSTSRSPGQYYRLMSWIFKLNKSGMEVWWSANSRTSVEILLALYRQSKKSPEEQKAFNSYYRVKPPRAVKNSHVQTLMGVSKGRLGVARASQLVDVFGSSYAVYTAPVRALIEIIGPAAARTFLDAIGRNPDYED